MNIQNVRIERAPKATRAEVDARRAELVKLLEAGNLSARKMAIKLDCPVKWVYETIRADPNLRLPPSNDPTRDLAPIGPIRETLRKQDRAFLEWLGDSLSDGSTVVELLVACAVDAWLDETTPDTVSD